MSGKYVSLQHGTPPVPRRLVANELLRFGTQNTVVLVQTSSEASEEATVVSALPLTLKLPMFAPSPLPLLRAAESLGFGLDGTRQYPAGDERRFEFDLTLDRARPDRSGADDLTGHRCRSDQRCRRVHNQYAAARRRSAVRSDEEV
jgi:hypothetical protein